MTNEREEFEKWAKKHEVGTMRVNHSYMSNGAYLAWAAWQAATLAERERCALVAETYVNIDRQGVINKIRGE